MAFRSVTSFDWLRFSSGEYFIDLKSSMTAMNGAAASLLLSELLDSEEVSGLFPISQLCFEFVHRPHHHPETFVGAKEIKEHSNKDYKDIAKLLSMQFFNCGGERLC